MAAAAHRDLSSVHRLSKTSKAAAAAAALVRVLLVKQLEAAGPSEYLFCTIFAQYNILYNDVVTFWVKPSMGQMATTVAPFGLSAAAGRAGEGRALLVLHNTVQYAHNIEQYLKQYTAIICSVL